MAWERWINFTERIGIYNPLHQHLTNLQQQVMLQSFIAFTHQNRRRRQEDEPYLTSTVRATLTSVAKAFTIHGCEHPVYLTNGIMVLAFNEMLKRYTVSDLPTKQQEAISPSILREAYNSATLSREKQHATLLTEAHFFKCRSSEYLQVSGTRRMTTITADDVCSFKNIQEIRHRKETSTSVLMLVDVITITLWLQKNNEKYATIAMYLCI